MSIHYCFMCGREAETPTDDGRYICFDCKMELI
jgi:DNA-directed RNA polymerase subunit RPC12/RpoP